MNKIKSYFIAHKIISIIGLIVIIIIGYSGYKKFTSTAGDTRYITAKVERGTIIASISGSGQVSASSQIDIKPNVTGAITHINVIPGSIVTNGQTLFVVDDKDAQKTVRDAEISLESAQVALDKLKIQNSSENMNANLARDYDNGFNTVSDVFLDLPGIMNGMNDIFFKSTNGTSQLNIDWYAEQATSDQIDQAKTLKQRFLDSYNTATKAYNDNFKKYQLTPRTADSTTIEMLISQTYDTAKLVSDAIKNANNYIDFVNNSFQNRNSPAPAIINTHKASLNTFTSKINTHLINLLSIETAIKADKDAFPNADLDTQSEELDIKQKQNILQDAKDKLLDYSIHAPFSGTIASVPINKGDNVSSSTTLGTIITEKKIATISLNEVDVAKIKLGQKVTLTFDAVPNLTITGEVAEIDSVGTVSQGVVTYNVKISFDTQDKEVKPGMSVNAAIITNIKQDVLILPNSAVKSGGGQDYVESFDAPLLQPTDGLIGSISKIAPNKIPVEVGLSNDSQTEIVSGVKESDEIVTRTILPTVKTATAPSIFGSTTGNRGGAGGGVRIPAR